MNSLKIVLLSLFTSALAIAAEPSHVSEYLGVGGKMNWTTGKVTAEGFGAAPEGKRKKVAGLLACRAAIVDAQRNLLEATNGVRVSAETVVSNFVAQSDTVKSTVEGLVKGARIAKREPGDDSCKVVLEIPLGGQASNTIYQQAFGEGEELSAKRIGAPQNLTEFLALLNPISPAYAATQNQPLQPWAEALNRLDKRLTQIEQKLSQASPAIEKAAQQDLPTGLIIDARGSNFIPSMSPKVRKIRGGVVYPAKRNKSSILSSGRLVSLFAKNVDFALNHPIVGEKPLLVKALRTWGKTRTEIVLGQESADNVVELNKAGFFNNAGVIIVLD